MKDIQTSDIWINKKVYDDAETAHYEALSRASLTPLADEVAKARQQLMQSRDTFTSAVGAPTYDSGAMKFFEKRVVDFEKSIQSVLDHLKRLDVRVSAIENSFAQYKPAPAVQICPAKKETKPADDDDDVDLFGSDSDEETEAAAKVREERLAAYNAKKSKKPVLIAKSNVILDVKPWDDETDMKAMEAAVRKIVADGLLWGAAKLVPLAYGIHKLQISCVVEDDKVSIDWLQEQLEAIEDYVQSIDIAAFNKI